MDRMPSGEKHGDNEYANLEAVPGSFKKVVVINRFFVPYTNDEGILVIPLEDFLLNLNSLDM